MSQGAAVTAEHCKCQRAAARLKDRLPHRTDFRPHSVPVNDINCSQFVPHGGISITVKVQSHEIRVWLFGASWQEKTSLIPPQKGFSLI